MCLIFVIEVFPVGVDQFVLLKTCLRYTFAAMLHHCNVVSDIIKNTWYVLYIEMSNYIEE